jgi:hypothetical protein
MTNRDAGASLGATRMAFRIDPERWLVAMEAGRRSPRPSTTAAGAAHQGVELRNHSLERSRGWGACLRSQRFKKWSWLKLPSYLCAKKAVR